MAANACRVAAVGARASGLRRRAGGTRESEEAPGYDVREAAVVAVLRNEGGGGG